MLYQIINVVAPTFIVVAVGWLWGRVGYKFDHNLVTSLIMNVGGPCLIFSTLCGLEISPSLMGTIGLATLVAIFIFGAIGFVVLKWAGLSSRAFLAPLMFPNIGNIGLPICLFAYGKTGLALAVMVFAVFSLFQFTMGIRLYSGSSSFLNLFKEPIIYSVIASVIFIIKGSRPPDILLRTADLLGAFTIPLMLLSLGVTLSNLKIMNIKRSLLLSLLRVGMGFGVSLALAYLFKMSHEAKGVFVLQCSMPVAVFNYMLAERYNRSPKQNAELLMVSTLLSLVTLPLILRFLL
jgi:malate permease and related proteins